MMAGVGVAENLSESEQRVWDAFATGSLVDFRTRNAAGDDPAAGRGRGPHRQVRAEVVCALLHGAVVPEPGCAGRVSLRGAHASRGCLTSGMLRSSTRCGWRGATSAGGST